jgi:hypothetical protein
MDSLFTEKRPRRTRKLFAHVTNLPRLCDVQILIGYCQQIFSAATVAGPGYKTEWKAASVLCSSRQRSALSLSLSLYIFAERILSFSLHHSCTRERRRHLRTILRRELALEQISAIVPYAQLC